MRIIEKYERAHEINSTSNSPEERKKAFAGIELTVYEAYLTAKAIGSDILVFNDYISKHDIGAIWKELDEIEEWEFAITSRQAGMIEIIREFETGCMEVRCFGDVKFPGIGSVSAVFMEKTC